jgi:hypothetical protein
MNHHKVAIMKWMHHGVLASAAMLCSAASWAQVAIETVTGSIQGGAEVVRIDLSESNDWCTQWICDSISSAYRSRFSWCDKCNGAIRD